MGEEVAKILLQVKAILLQPNDPFTYASGNKGPIYCDHRILMSFPDEREAIIKEFLTQIQGMEFDVIAGTATSGIPWASWLAREKSKPLVYVRGKKKGHGRGNLIEGVLKEGQRALVVEDLINTGGSSIEAVKALREAGAHVSNCVAITTYGMEKSRRLFAEAGCKLSTLTDLNTILEIALEKNAITPEERDILVSWQENPDGWHP